METCRISIVKLDQQSRAWKDRHPGESRDPAFEPSCWTQHQKLDPGLRRDDERKKFALF
jgi:hypothetical protein